MPTRTYYEVKPPKAAPCDIHCITIESNKSAYAFEYEVPAMTVIDVHAHIYPEKIASKAVDAIGSFYSTSMYGKGTSEHLLSSMESSPITNFVVHSVATNARSVESINDFIASECAQHPEFTGFMAMHQDYADPEKEIERAVELGLKGMKIHPDTQEVNLDDPRLMRVYEMIQGRLPIIIHMGDYRHDFSHPRRLKNVLHAFPDLVVDAAHFGGWSMPEVAYDLLGEERCFIDMSSSMFWLGKRRTKELCKLYGTDRVLFGSDFPMWDPVSEYNAFTSIDFSDNELEDMLWHNAERFLGSAVNG